MGLVNQHGSPNQSHVINYVTLTNYAGRKYDLTNVMQQIIIYEDLLQTCYQSGTIAILDDNALHLNLPLTGEEWLEVSFQTRVDGAAVGDKEFKKKYKILGLNNLSKEKNNENQVLIMSFVSEGFWLSETHLFSKSYSNTVPSDVVTDLMVSGLGLTVDVEATLYPRNWIIPNVQAFDFIRRLADESTSKDNLSSDFKFFENIDGWHFKSLYTLSSADFKKRLNYNVDNMTPFDRLNVSSYKKDTHFDIENQMHGGLKMTLDELDTIQKRVVRSTADKSTFRSAFTGMNSESVYMSGTDSYPSDMYYRLTTGNQGYSTNRETEINQRIKRIMNRALMDISQVTVKLPGNLDLMLGDTIYFDFYHGTLIDHTTSGKYVICKIKHEITTNEYNMTMNIRKDSNIKGDKFEE